MLQIVQYQVIVLVTRYTQTNQDYAIKIWPKKLTNIFFLNSVRNYELRAREKIMIQKRRDNTRTHLPMEGNTRNLHLSRPKSETFWSRAGKAGKALAFVAACLTTMSSATAQEQQTLKYAYVLPATHYLWTEGAKIFTEEVTAGTNGNVAFEVYPAAQLGKDNLAVLNSGLADLALIIPSYSSDKMPLSTVSELPGMYADSCEGTSKFWEIAKPGGILYEEELKPLGLYPLFAAVLIPYRILTSSKEVSKIEDLNGLKIRANGSAMNKTMHALNAVPVRASSPELYDAVSRGTVDGALFTLNALEQYSLDQVLNYMVEGPQLGSAGIIIAMTEKKWNTLSAETQKVMTNAAEMTQKRLCKWMDEDEKKVRNKLVSSGKLKPKTLTAEEIAEWHQQVESVAADWANEMNGVGKKGKEVLKAFQQANSSQ